VRPVPGWPDGRSLDDPGRLWWREPASSALSSWIPECITSPGWVAKVIQQKSWSLF
jgi:hypothetical protein